MNEASWTTQAHHNLQICA